jgi:hypothetical protein
MEALPTIIVAYFVLWISGKSVEKIAEIAKIAPNRKSKTFETRSNGGSGGIYRGFSRINADKDNCQKCRNCQDETQAFSDSCISVLSVRSVVRFF